ncbi:hypothetical protein BC833DRAFT_566534 [Globomyces pollinis-pini]|nr:hypothetical protein BC833DRAFT_566534 [Globomyces pollinis-pini]KAJ2995188.1 hypothetical protein HDV02_001014 [Globomyces sp. JEL0801]
MKFFVFAVSLVAAQKLFEIGPDGQPREVGGAVANPAPGGGNPSSNTGVQPVFPAGAPAPAGAPKQVSQGAPKVVQAGAGVPNLPNNAVLGANVDGTVTSIAGGAVITNGPTLTTTAAGQLPAASTINLSSYPSSTAKASPSASPTSAASISGYIAGAVIPLLALFL